MESNSVAETKRVVLEGDVTLAYKSSECHGKHVLVQPDTSPDDSPVGGAMVGCDSLHLEEFIARQLEFPNDAEFDGMIQRLDRLRNQGLQPADDVPDIVREGVKLRITVEVL
jgi:hypothetical protein